MNETLGARGPLDGVRVVDLATERAELAGRVLADLGAQVMKVEPPNGAAARQLPPFDLGREDDADGSLYWETVALGKQSVVLDLAEAAGRERLSALIASADVLIESFGAIEAGVLGLSDDALDVLNPALIHVSVTPYGRTGPMADAPATDLTIEAAGGLLGLQGDGDRPPVPVGFPQASFHAGVQAAADVIIALCEREQSGRGQHLDLSMQAAIVWTLMNATGYPPNTGEDPPGTSVRRAEPQADLLPGVRPPRLWSCADGHVTASLGLGSLGARSLNALMRRLERTGDVPEDLRGISWAMWPAEVQEGRLAGEQVGRAFALVGEAFRRTTKRTLLDWALEDGLLLAPINTVAEVRADAQLAARGYWQEIGGRVHPGAFALLSRTPVRLGRPAPALGVDQSLLNRDAGGGNRVSGAENHDTGPGESSAGSSRPEPDARLPALGPRPSVHATRPPEASQRSPFAGLKVADFAWVGVGPITSKALADHGATVVHVESTASPDVLRLMPPFRDRQPGIDRGQFMADFNSSKLGLALNLSTEAGRALARRLIGWADVVVESFTPGTMARWGLDYETVSRSRPDLVMLSTCLRGQTGPERAYGGFGGQGAALAGLHGITGWPDRPPAGPWGAYTDFIAPRYAVSALAAALFHRARTGEGQSIDLSQVEAAVHFIEPLLLDHDVNGQVAGPAGHDSSRACPHGVYPAAGIERYVAVEAATAAQWQALRDVAPLDAFAGADCDTLAGRLARREAIDAALAAWTRDQEPWALAQRLRSAGVPASVVQRPSDLYNDEQLAHLGFFVMLDHSVMGPTPYDGPATLFSATPATPRHAAPCLGEHTAMVLTELLGLSAEQVAEYAAAGALS